MTIAEIPDVLTQEEVRRCREALERATWHDGRETAGDMVAHAKNNRQLAQDDPLADRLGTFVLERLGRSERFMATALPLKVLPPRFSRYESGESYDAHIDNAIFSVPGTPHRIRSDLSATLFFSDPDEYEGGELTIEGEPGQCRIKLPSGHMAVYPSGTVHRVAPIGGGTRYAAFFWIQSLVREDHRRAMLLELDDAIRALRADLPEDASLVRLTGLYHNLLREWTDT